MKSKIAFLNIDSSNAVRNYIAEKADEFEAFQHFHTYDDFFQTVIKKKDLGYSCRISFKDKFFNLNARADDINIINSFNMALMKLKQLYEKKRMKYFKSRRPSKKITKKHLSLLEPV